MGTYDLFRKIAQSNLTSKERTVNQMKYDIVADFEDSPSFETILINNVLRDVQIVNESNIIKNPNKKRVLCKPDETISIGDLVLWGTDYWLCTEEDKTNPVYEVGLISKCNNTLSVYKNGVVTQIPVIVQTNINLYKLGEESNKYLSEPSSNIIVICQNNSITSQIKRYEIYKLRTQNYKVIDWNDDIQPNMIVLKMEFTAESQSIPEDAEIPDSGVSYTLTGEDSIIKGYSENYTAIKYIDGEVDDTAEFTFSIIGDVPTSAYTLTVIDVDECRIKANSSVYTVTLRASDNSNAQFIEKNITLQNIF